MGSSRKVPGSERRRFPLFARALMTCEKGKRDAKRFRFLWTARWFVRASMDAKRNYCARGGFASLRGDYFLFCSGDIRRCMRAAVEKAAFHSSKWFILLRRLSSYSQGNAPRALVIITMAKDLSFPLEIRAREPQLKCNADYVYYTLQQQQKI